MPLLHELLWCSWLFCVQRFSWCSLTRGRLVMTEVSQSRSRLLNTTTAIMFVFLYSFEEWGAASGYIRRMVVREPTSLSKPCTGALFTLVTQMKLWNWLLTQCRRKISFHWCLTVYLIMMSYWSICDPRWVPWRIPPLAATTHRLQLPSLFSDGGKSGWGREASAAARCSSLPWNPRGGDRFQGSGLSRCTNTGMSWRPSEQDRCLRWFRHQWGRQGLDSREADRLSKAWTEGSTFNLRGNKSCEMHAKMYPYQVFGVLVVITDGFQLVRGEISRNQNSRIASDQQRQAEEKVLLSLQQILKKSSKSQHKIIIVIVLITGPESECSTNILQAAPAEKKISGVSLWDGSLPVKARSYGLCSLRQLRRAIIWVLYTQVIQRHHDSSTSSMKYTHSSENNLHVMNKLSAAETNLLKSGL